VKITPKWIQQHLTMPVVHDLKRLSPRIKCADSTGVSVQASETHFCSPKSNLGPYDSVEVLFMNNGEPNGWVPIDQIVKYINSHGGVK